jgi:hypothetical protein
MARCDRYCSASECRRSGQQRTSLPDASNDAHDRKRGINQSCRRPPATLRGHTGQRIEEIRSQAEIN